MNLLLIVSSTHQSLRMWYSQADAQHAMPLPGVAIAHIEILLQQTS